MALDTVDVWKIFCCKLHFYIRKWISDPEVAKDIEQEVFIKIHEKINTLKDDAKVVSWVLQITKNTVFDYLRKENIFSPEDDNADHIEMDDSEMIFKQPERNLEEELTSGVKTAIENLPFKYKQALLLVEFEGLSQVDLAKKLNISLSGAKSRVQRGRLMIKEQLLNCCNYQFDKYGSVIGVKPNSCSNS
jgi:RNA polymerase sigma-70 factor (ECF subfamily)